MGFDDKTGYGIPEKEKGPSSMRRAALFSIDKIDRLHYWLTVIRSLIVSNVPFGTTFFATNSPFTR